MSELDMTLPNTIQIAYPVPNYPVFEISHPAASARIALHGAHLLEWTPTGQSPVLYLSPKSLFQEGKPVRGGVPICWPWFGPHDSSTALPSHGFVRNHFWKLDEASENDSGVTLKLSFRDNAETRSIWPHAFHLTLECSIGTSLSLSLTMTNTGDKEFTITDALHTYFAVGDIQNVSIGGLSNLTYLDTTGQRQEHVQAVNILFEGEVDRIYRSSSPVAIHDASWQRIIAIKSEGSNSTVVWNPWKEKAARLHDLPDEDYQHFVCVETANAWQDRITLSPGATHRLVTTITCESAQA